MAAIPLVWSEAQRLHDPGAEIWVGVRTPAVEVAARADAIRAELERAGHPVVAAAPQPDGALEAVHDRALLDFLAGAWREWEVSGLIQDPGQDRVVPYFFPHPGLLGTLMPALPAATWARTGHFAFDTMTLIGPGTWTAARAAAYCAETAAQLVAGGEPMAYALCRPPGHHATHAGFGGSCYLNNAAVAAETLRGQGFARVGVIDLDAHHGNGTAAIFYERSDVLYGSVHVDPAAGWFPHIVGFADETGRGAGEGATRNLPLAEGTADEGWLDAVRELVAWAVAGECTSLVVSLGVDAANDDPESPLLVTRDGYREAGVLVGASGLPTVTVQEGGYHLATLGGLVAEYLSGDAAGRPHA